VNTGRFLIRFSNGRINTSPVKEVPLFLTKHDYLIFKKVDFKTAVSAGILIHGTHCGNHWYGAVPDNVSST
jgi:hypothetical protein